MGPNRRFIAVITLFILGILLGVVAQENSVKMFDVLVSRFLQSYTPFWLVDFNKFISLFESAEILIVLFLAIFFWQRKKKGQALLVILAGLSSILVRVLKLSFAGPCPAVPDVTILYTFRNFLDILYIRLNQPNLLDIRLCYPSGHVFDYITLWGTVFYLRKEISLNVTVQKLLAIFPLALILLVGESRIYLGAHWLTDVLGGYFFGFAWLLVLILIYENWLVKVIAKAPRA